MVNINSIVVSIQLSLCDGVTTRERTTNGYG